MRATGAQIVRTAERLAGRPLGEVPVADRPGLVKETSAALGRDALTRDVHTALLEAWYDAAEAARGSAPDQAPAAASFGQRQTFGAGGMSPLGAAMLGVGGGELPARSIPDRFATETPKTLELKTGESWVYKLQFRDGATFAFRTGMDGLSEAAAWRLARKVGLEGVAIPAELAQFEGMDGVAQAWTPGKTGLDLGEDISVNAWDSPLLDEQTKQDALLLRLLSGARDNHAGQWLMRDDGQGAALLDFAGGFFDSWLEDYEGALLARLTSARPEVLDRLRALSPEDAREIVAPLRGWSAWSEEFGERAVHGILHRRDRILEKLDA